MIAADTFDFEEHSSRVYRSCCSESLCKVAASHHQRTNNFDLLSKLEHGGTWVVYFHGKFWKFLRKLELTKKRRLSVAAIWTHWTLFRQMWGLKAVLGKCFAFQRETSTIQFIFLLKETPFRMITQHPSLYSNFSSSSPLTWAFPFQSFPPELLNKHI